MIEAFIAKYGLFGIFLGAGFEGETVALLGGVLAHRHLLPYLPTALAACAGSFFADQMFFLAGRNLRRLAFVQRLAASEAGLRANRMLERHPTGFILAFRFIYGIRTISPVAIGLSTIPARRFLVLNAAAALAWGFLITTLGYFFGGMIERLFGFLALHLHLAVAMAGALIVAILAGFALRHMLKGPDEPDPSEMHEPGEANARE